MLERMVTGLDVGSWSVKAAELKVGLRSIELVRLEQMRLGASGDLEARSAALAEFFISLNCRRTSSTMAEAALPTARMANAENRNGSMAPNRRPTTTVGWPRLMSKPVILSAVRALISKALNNARAVSAADPMANPLPIAAVVLPVASRASVRLRTSGSRPAISARPPALSATGP